MNDNFAMIMNLGVGKRQMQTVLWDVILDHINLQ